jgi:hypothetical protein
MKDSLKIRVTRQKRTKDFVFIHRDIIISMFRT